MSSSYASAIRTDALHHMDQEEDECLIDPRDRDEDEGDDSLGEDEEDSRPRSVPRAESINSHPIRIYCLKFFKLQAVKDLFKELDPQRKVISYYTYAREFIVWNFHREGADPAKEDDRTKMDTLKYLRAILSNGKIQGRKMTIEEARGIPLIATAEKLEHFIEYFTKHRKR